MYWLSCSLLASLVLFICLQTMARFNSHSSHTPWTAISARLCRFSSATNCRARTRRLWPHRHVGSYARGNDSANQAAKISLIFIGHGDYAKLSDILTRFYDTCETRVSILIFSLTSVCFYLHPPHSVPRARSWPSI